jgi:hypothetical protein
LKKDINIRPNSDLRLKGVDNKNIYPLNVWWAWWWEGYRWTPQSSSASRANSRSGIRYDQYHLPFKLLYALIERRSSCWSIYNQLLFRRPARWSVKSDKLKENSTSWVRGDSSQTQSEWYMKKMSWGSLLLLDFEQNLAYAALLNTKSLIWVPNWMMRGKTDQIEWRTVVRRAQENRENSPRSDHRICTESGSLD